MQSPSADKSINYARAAVDMAVSRLAIVLEAHCPGYHSPTQHNDGRPSWCTSCGYTVHGDRVERTR